MALRVSGLMLLTADEQKLNVSLINWIATSRSISILLGSLFQAMILAGTPGRGMPLDRLHAAKLADAMGALNMPKIISSALRRELYNSAGQGLVARQFLSRRRF